MLEFKKYSHVARKGGSTYKEHWKPYSSKFREIFRLYREDLPYIHVDASLKMIFDISRIVHREF